MKDFALKLCAVIFLLVSMMHSLRLIFNIPVTVKGAPLPMFVSIFGVIVPLALAIWIFSLFKK